MIIKTCSKLNTLYHQLPDQTVCAAVILPSAAECFNSPSRCQIDTCTGTLTVPEDTLFLKDSSVEEVNNPEFRMKAWHNYKLITSWDCTPGAMFGFEQYILEWMKKVKANKLRLFFGGDFSCMEQLQCAINAARHVPDKRIYIRTGRIVELNDMTLAHAIESVDVPENIFIFAESGSYEDIYLGSFPECTFQKDGTMIDLDFFPTTKENVTLMISPKSEYHIRTKSPWWMEALHSRHKQNDRPETQPRI